jgi:hypothetical protein
LIGLILSCDTERNIPLPEDCCFLKFYGVEGEQTGVDFVQTPDNAIVMVGNSTQPGRTQMIYVLKVDLLGNVIWENFIGLADKNNTVKDIELHLDGRLVIAGETEIVVGNRDVFLKILDGDGGELDSIRYGSNSVSDEEVKSITIVDSGGSFPAGYIISGSTTDVPFDPTKPNDTKDGLHLRISDQPLTLAGNSWVKKDGVDNSEDVIIKTLQFNSTTYYCFGYTNASVSGFTDYKYWVFKINDFGISSNNAFLGVLGNPNEDEILTTCIDVNTSDLFDRGYLLGGIATDASGNTRSYFVKLKRELELVDAGDVQQVVYPTILGDGINQESLNGFYNIANNDFLILSTQNTNSNLAENMSLLKLDREIQTVWGPEIFGGRSFDEAGAVLQLADGKIMVLGTMTVGGLSGQKKMALMKLNSEGKLLR